MIYRATGALAKHFQELNFVIFYIHSLEAGNAGQACQRCCKAVIRFSSHSLGMADLDCLETLQVSKIGCFMTL